MALTLQQRVGRAGLILGPVLALALHFALPETFTNAQGQVVAFSQAGRATLAMMAWMATWWMTEAVDIEVTALLPIAAFPLAGIMPLARTTANYGADVIFLFLGGFVLALAIQRWGLDRRIAFATLKLVGTRPKAIVGGTMAATAFVSMWVSNTATAAMMVPIVLSVIDVALRRRTGRGLAEHGGIPLEDRDLSNFAFSALLGVAYAASIGGLGTIIGSPPNGILVRFVEQSGRHPHRLSGVDGDRRADDAGLPAAGLVPQHDCCCFPRVWARSRAGASTCATNGRSSAR
jgi:sodium-dependent dicarboxylate transporter 2/3/5